METIALSAMVFSFIILLQFSHSIENVRCCSNVHCRYHEFVHYTIGRRENMKESCHIYQSINLLIMHFLMNHQVKGLTYGLF